MGAAPSSAPSFCCMCFAAINLSLPPNSAIMCLPLWQGFKGAALKALHHGGRERDGAPGHAGHRAYIILLWEVTYGRQWSDWHPLLLSFGHHQQDTAFLSPTEEERINQERHKEEENKGSLPQRHLNIETWADPPVQLVPELSGCS